VNLDDALARLFRRNLHVVKLDLAPMAALAGRLGRPEQSFLSVHVAGTNGKGSVCALVAAMLRAQGYRTGLYTSPHLVRFNERIQVDGVPIADEALRVLIDEVEGAARGVVASGLRDVTFFEFTTALALEHFRRAGVQVAVLETGMGGRLDATNIVTPAVAAITSIGFDHQAYLGDTLEKIAAEKAGIIKPGRPVVIGALPAEARAVMAVRASAVGAPLTWAEEAVNVRISRMALDGQSVSVAGQSADYGTVRTALCGVHQAANLAVAVGVAECLDQAVGVPVSIDAVRAGIAGARWPARCQLVQEQPPVVVDGGHNVDAAEVLAKWLGKVAGRRPVGLVVGFLADKDPEAFLRPLARRAVRVWVAPIDSERAMALDEVMRRVAFLPQVEAAADPAAALDAARAWAVDQDGMVLVCGSLYLAGEALRLSGAL
jgi:dihydrofolate synthase/folylpolyglutamate synthase